jgi:hypothetical protein
MALIKGKQLAESAIVEAKLASSAVTVSKIADTQITAAKLNISAQTWDFSTALAFSVPTPTDSAHAATKSYVDSAVQGLDIKASVRLATAAVLDNWDVNTTNKTLTAPSIGATSIDGVSIADGDRILVKNQADGVENGIYVVTTLGDGSTATVLTRASDFNTAALASPGSFTFVEEGTANADTGWVLSTNAPIVLYTTALTFTQFSSAGVVTAGNGLTKAGNQLSVNAGDGLGFDTGALKVNVGNGLEIATDNVQIKVRNSSVGTHADGLQAAVSHVQTATGPDPAISGANSLSTGITISATPAGDSFVQVLVNGVMIELGDGVKTKDAYFSVDSGVNARAISAIASGDTLYWNASIAFELDSSDRIDIIYAKLPQ